MLESLTNTVQGTHKDKLMQPEVQSNAILWLCMKPSLRDDELKLADFDLCDFFRMEQLYICGLHKTNAKK